MKLTEYANVTMGRLGRLEDIFAIRANDRS